MDIFMSIIDTKPVLASRKEEWVSELKKMTMTLHFLSIMVCWILLPGAYFYGALFDEAFIIHVGENIYEDKAVSKRIQQSTNH